MDNPFCRRWLRGFWLVLALPAGVIFAFRVAAMVQQGPYYVTTGFEDISIFNISRMSYGDPVYVDPFAYPYRASLFNWLFYRMYGGVAGLLRPGEVELPTYLRLLTLAWALVGIGTMLVLVRGDWPTALGLALVAWLGPMIGWWSLTVRPDVPAVVCELLGIALVARGEPRMGLRRAAAAGIAFFLAWSFKQSAIGIFAGTLLALVLRREWANLAIITGGFAVLTALVLLTASPAYFLNLFDAPSLAAFTSRQLTVLLFWFAILWGPLLVLGLLLVLGMPGLSRRAMLQSRPVFFLAVVFGVVLVLNLLAARRPGGSQNYFFETWLIGLGLTGLIGQHAAGDPEAFTSRPARSLLAGSSLILLLYCIYWAVPLFSPLDKPDTQPVEIMLRLPRGPYSPELLEAVRQSPRPILCEDSFLVRHALGPASAGVPVVDHTIYNDALEAGRLSRPDIIERIRNREYVNIWLFVRGSHWEAFVKEAGYKLVGADGDIRHYRR
jgi:hypothetical protein